MDELEHVVADINWIRQIAADGLRPSESAAALIAAELSPQELRAHPIYAHYSEPSVQVLQKFVRQPLGFYFLGVYCQRQARQVADWLTTATSERVIASSEAKLPHNGPVCPSAAGVAACIHFLFALPSVDDQVIAVFAKHVCSVFLDVDCPLPNQCEQLLQLVQAAESASSRPKVAGTTSAHRDGVVWYAKQVPTMLLTDDDSTAAAKYCQLHSYTDSPDVEVASSLGDGETQVACHSGQKVAESNLIQLRGPVVDGLLDAWVTTAVPPQAFISGGSSKIELAPFSQLRDVLLVKLVLDNDGKRWQHFVSSPEFTRFVSLGAVVSERRSVSAQDFVKFRILGKGAQGEVYGGIHELTGKPFAIKEIPKAKIMSPDEGPRSASPARLVLSAEVERMARHRRRINRSLLWRERTALIAMAQERASSATSGVYSFVLSLTFSFQTPTHLALVFDIMLGGSLQFYLKKNGRFGLDQARFYAAEVALGLQHLQDHGIIYRDLKPHNIMLDSSGHVCITDLGLVQFVKMEAGRPTPGQFFQLQVGTRGYWAPEVLQRQTRASPDTMKVEQAKSSPATADRTSPSSASTQTSGFGCYSFAADWWSFGVLLYQMLSGICPFRNAGIVYSAGLDPKKASQEQCRSLFDEATIKGEFGLPWAMRLQTRQFHASGSRVGGRSRSVHTPRSSTKFGRTGHRGGRSKSIKQAEEATAARSATQSPHSRVGAGMDDSASAPTTGQSDTGDLSIGIYVSTTSAAGKSAGPANWSHSNSETTKKLEIGVSATVIPSWLIEKYALQPVYEFPEEACDLLRKLLQRDPTQRLGGVNFPSRTHLHSHPFFETLDWDRIARKQHAPPFVPSQRINADSQRQLHRESTPRGAGGQHAGPLDRGARFPTTKVPSGEAQLRPMPDIDGWNFVCQDAYQRELVQLLVADSSDSLRRRRPPKSAGSTGSDSTAKSSKSRLREVPGSVDTSCGGCYIS